MVLYKVDSSATHNMTSKQTALKHPVFLKQSIFQQSTLHRLLSISAATQIAAFTLSAISSLSAQHHQTPNLPEYSWDRVSVCLHFGSHHQLTDEQIKLTASLSNLICIEKAHGQKTNHKQPELIQGADARRIKKFNPKAKVLFYWNTLIAWPFTSANQDFDKKPEDWILRDNKTGDPLLKSKLGNKPVYQYNLLNTQVTNWWSKTGGTMVKDLGFDGVFMDAVSQSKRPIWLRKGWGIGKEDELDTAVHDMMNSISEVMGKDKLIIYNGFRTKGGAIDGAAAGGSEFLSSSHGAMIEHFDQFKSNTKEDMLIYWKLAKEASNQGKIVIYKAWPGQDMNFANQAFMKVPEEKKLQLSKDNITYPLACYLIGAQLNSYFCYGWGYQVNHGQLVSYPEYEKPLGAPLEEYVRNEWIFTREFKHASVWLDLENRKSKIVWK